METGFVHDFDHDMEVASSCMNTDGNPNYNPLQDKQQRYYEFFVQEFEGHNQR